MKSDTPWGLVIVFTLAIFVIIGAIIVGIDEGRCTPAKRGVVKSPGKYGGPLEVCNGTEWVEYRVELPTKE